MAVTPTRLPAAPAPRTTLTVDPAAGRTWVVHIDRPGHGNALTPTVVAELTAVLTEAQDRGVHVLALRGTAETFCSGMDLAAAGSAPGGPVADGSAFWDLLTGLRRSPLLVVAVVEALAAGGGIGLVAASDVVIATPAATFALPEALWGLLPCCVAPFLAERIGRRAGLRMALLTTPLGAAEAATLGLVDQLVEDPAQALRRVSLRAVRVDRGVQGRTKTYFAALPDRAEDARGLALGELADVMGTPLVTRNLTRYADEGTFPWEA